MISISSARKRRIALVGLSATGSALAFCASQSAFAQTTDRPGSEQTDPAQPVQSQDTQSAAGSGLKKPVSGSTSIDAQAQTDQSPVTPDDLQTPGQDAAEDEVVVTGLRQSLANAQSLKRNADTVVDAITAEDIGALPDRSVNEALQRVPGVAITRFAASNDSQHFSVQGSGVVIRGLSYVRGEFNGRDAFAVGGGREIGFNDIPTEIVGSVEVFKNLTADMIEGGISGSVNINTRKPFDSTKDLFFLSGSMTYGDLEERGAPSVVGLVSKTWDVGGGRFGILASGTYSQIRSRADSVFVSSYLPRYNDDTNGNGAQDAGEGRVINAGTQYQSTVFDSYPVPAGRDFVYAPLGGGSRTQSFDRRRLGISAAAQYENADRSLLVTAQFVRTESTEEWLEHTVEPNVYYGDSTTVFPIGDATYDDNGIFTSGTLGKTAGLIQGNRPNGAGYGPLTQFSPNGIFTTQSNRHFYSKATTQDQSLNIKWEPTERLHMNFDGQYVKSTLRSMDDILDTGTFSQVAIDTRGSIPSIQFVTPSAVTDANGNLVGGQQNTDAYFANPNSIYFRDAFNNVARNDGDEWAFRADAQYDVSEDGFLRNVRVGGRYADRKQVVRSNDYSNWGNVSETWASSGPVSFADIQQGDGTLYSFDNFFRGGAVMPPSTTFLPDNVLSNHDAMTALLRRVTAQGGGSYTPVEDRDGTRAANGQTQPNSALIDGYFRPGEIYRNREKTWSAYARADFGVEDFGNGMSLSGNIGVRYVRTSDESEGALTFPNSSSIFTPITEAGYGPSLAEYCRYQFANPNGQGTIPSICTLGAAQQAAILAFSNGATEPSTATQKFDHWLPSLNLKLQLTPQLLLRGAASKAISRPGFGDLRNFVGATPAGGNSAGNFGFQANARNPYLRPVEAKQFDVTAEWYFAKVGSLTGALFYKDLSNIIVDNFGYIRTATNNGQTFDIAINGPANVKGNASIKGAEVAYQQTFDFLPGALRGLGTQLTYTYVDAGNIPNAVPANGPADGARPPLDVQDLYGNLPLQGLSKHNFNASLFYDLGGLYARVAYSWRSEYLLTNRDCCFPFLPVMANAAGQLDGSLFYTVNPNFKIGIEAQNLLDTTTKTRFLLNGDGLTAPRSFFKSDRQYTLSVRLTM
ncbi:TonB-dependent receptor [Sphingomonas xinjiangensis]|uniref:TonB-dependent receptor n=1 Tax=Sphingomonas xinjiangensis TaxID=643568 RepID=A0A840YSN3_9SPHN|nr:TonB-dependent receptor [Sphingomonas xinjiangensis]MBB5712663.1 TonB-dependent receptor [Sphingomonas xinjiangensis]